jgi:NADH-quinone oxidoreductase subunit G
VDGLRTQRLDQPYIRENGRLWPATWKEAFALIAHKMRPVDSARVGAIAGDLCAVEEMYALKDLMGHLGSANVDARQDGSALDPAWGRASYLFNATVAGIERADALLIVGSNPRREAPVLNARIRKRWRAGNFPVGVIGDKADLTYSYDYLGAGADTLAGLAGSKFGEVLKKAKRPLILLGAGALARKDGAAIAALAAKIAVDCGAVTDGWNGFSVLHGAASRVGALDLGFTPGKGGQSAAQMAAGGVEVLFLLGADEVDVQPGPFVIYIGTHGDRGAHRADVILPGAAYPEKSGTYVNTEGRVQMGNRAAFPPGDAREDWAILRALSGVLGCTLPYDSLAQLRKAMFASHPALMRIGEIAPGNHGDIEKLARIGGSADKKAFTSSVADFYFTNPIARSSAVMAECSALANAAAKNPPMTAAE